MATRLRSIWRSVTLSARIAGSVDAVTTRSSSVTSSVPTFSITTDRSFVVPVVSAGVPGVSAPLPSTRMPISLRAASTANDSNWTCSDFEIVTTAVKVEPAGGAGGTLPGAPAGFKDADARRVCHPQPRSTTSRRPWMSTFSK